MTDTELIDLWIRNENRHAMLQARDVTFAGVFMATIRPQPF